MNRASSTKAIPRRVGRCTGLLKRGRKYRPRCGWFCASRPRRIVSGTPPRSRERPLPRRRCASMTASQPANDPDRRCPGALPGGSSGNAGGRLAVVGGRRGRRWRVRAPGRDRRDARHRAHRRQPADAGRDRASRPDQAGRLNGRDPRPDRPPDRRGRGGPTDWTGQSGLLLGRLRVSLGGIAVPPLVKFRLVAVGRDHHNVHHPNRVFLH